MFSTVHAVEWRLRCSAALCSRRTFAAARWRRPAKKHRKVGAWSPNEIRLLAGLQSYFFQISLMRCQYSVCIACMLSGCRMTRTDVSGHA